MKRFKKELERLKKEIADLEKKKEKNTITLHADSQDKSDKKIEKKF